MPKTKPKPKILHAVDNGHYLSVAEAAKSLGIDKASVRNYLTWGWLTAYKFKSLTLIDRKEVDEWKQKKQAE